MAESILATKLSIPQLQPSVISRPRLFERLDEGLHQKLTLISAPAGFGKTTLVSEWIGRHGHPAGWLSLDEADSDPTRFLTYLTAVLQKNIPGIAAGMPEALRTPQPPPIDSILTALINEIASVSDSFLLVLDDYHLIDTRVVDYALTFLLDHLPLSMHLVIITRQDPSLGLARMRAGGQLTEIRVNDLRFTPGEAATFLKETMGLSLTADDIAELESRTEGWIAGLQLAALSMRGHEDASGFIKAFAGDDRFIVDYLVEEVLQRQPEHVRRFLLQTSILSRLNGSLCDAVSGRKDGNTMLEFLQRGNFFVMRLDEKRRWYRYHRLFANVLSVQLVVEQPDQVPEFHRRASEWYEQYGFVAEAIEHALKAEDFERAASLVERALPDLRRSRQDVTVSGWLSALPDELIQVRPVLSVGYAWTLLASHQHEGVESRLRDAEKWLAPKTDAPERSGDIVSAAVIVDTDEFSHLPATIAVYRAVSAQLLGDVSATVRHAREVLELSSEDDNLRLGAAEALLGLASWASGDLELAHHTFTSGMTRVHRAGNISDVINGAMILADIRIAQGRLHQAMQTYERALLVANEHGSQVVRGMADLYVGMSELHCERNDLLSAESHLQRSLELGEHSGIPQNRSRWYAAMARIREASGDLSGAIDLLGEAERVYVRDFSPDVRPLAASRARVWIKQDRFGEVFGWVREQGLSIDAELSYLREFEHITLARMLLARGERDRDRANLVGLGLLERLQHAAETGGRTGSLIEILVLQSMGHYGNGDVTTALSLLRQALVLAEPEGYVRIFIDEGQPMLSLLARAAKRREIPDYARLLLRTFDNASDRIFNRQPLIDPLSERELDVLRLLGTDLGGPAIAYQLLISLNTLRTHTRNIYAKLGVNSRRAAVHRAEELGLSARTTNRSS